MPVYFDIYIYIYRHIPTHPYVILVLHAENPCSGSMQVPPCCLQTMARGSAEVADRLLIARTLQGLGLRASYTTRGNGKVGAYMSTKKASGFGIRSLLTITMRQIRMSRFKGQTTLKNLLLPDTAHSVRNS